MRSRSRQSTRGSCQIRRNGSARLRMRRRMSDRVRLLALDYVARSLRRRQHEDEARHSISLRGHRRRGGCRGRPSGIDDVRVRPRIEPLDMLAAQGVGLGSACFEFALTSRLDRQGHGRHISISRAVDRRIDDLAGNRLACLSGAPHHGLLTDVDRDRLAILPAVMHPHALAAQTTQHATLQQGRSLPRRPPTAARRRRHGRYRRADAD